MLKQLKIKADVIGVDNNNAVSKYYLKLHPSGKINKIDNCANEIALGLKSYSIPIIDIIPEKGLVTIEVLTKPQDTVKFSEVYKSVLTTKEQIPIVLGKRYNGEDLIADLVKMPHLLIAGTTGSGKSTLLHSIICSLILQSNSNIKLVLIDPKSVEFIHYRSIKQLMYPIVNYADEGLIILSNLIDEMNRRFKCMSKASTKNIFEFNKKKSKSKKLPYIIFIIDEFSDLMQVHKKEFQTKLNILAQKSRACGIHIIVATQRPSADMVTGIIKANFPTRISCRVVSAINSRVVLDKNGAEKLLGKGDALIDSHIYNMLRFKGAYLNQNEILKVCDNNARGWFNKIINYTRIK